MLVFIFHLRLLALGVLLNGVKKLKVSTSQNMYTEMSVVLEDGFTCLYHMACSIPN